MASGVHVTDMPVSEASVALAVALVYAVYCVIAVFAIRAAWRKTAHMPDIQRVAWRSLAIAAFVAPTLAGARIAPFMLGVVASIALDLFFVRPLTMAWAAERLSAAGWYMFLPFLATWAVMFAGGLIAVWAWHKK